MPHRRPASLYSAYHNSIRRLSALGGQPQTVEMHRSRTHAGPQWVVVGPKASTTRTYGDDEEAALQSATAANNRQALRIEKMMGHR